jgi:hypothetical protein
MNALRTLTWRAAAALAGIGLVLVAGCGDDTGIARRYRVSGTVTYKGEPVPKGNISFIPTAPGGREASGAISNGWFTLTTATPDDGALPGSYKVTVLAQDIDTTELQAIAHGGQHHHDAKRAKAFANAKNLVPSRYKLADTSDLTAEVKPQSNSFPFELKD